MSLKSQITLTELIKMAWNNKKVMIIFLLISIFMGTMLTGTKDAEYHSTIEVTVDLVPSFPGNINIKSKNILKEFINKLYSEDNFRNWGENTVEILFENSKSSDLNIRTIKDKKIIANLSHKNINTYNEIIDYFEFTNTTLTNKYTSRVLYEKKIIEDAISKSPDGIMMRDLLQHDRFINSVNSGMKLFKIEDQPSDGLHSSGIYITLLLYLIMGLLLGVIYLITIEQFKRTRS
tara:strand:+ start:215 stop:916 length:702 start_codon:yes stop_codon:yes gene_type:complete